MDLYLHPIRRSIELTKEDTFLDGEIEYLVATGKPATGQVSIYFESGALDFRYNLYNGKKHGLYEEFFDNGDLEYWCHYSRDRKDFYDETYDKYGRLIGSDGWHQGLRHGRCRSYELDRLSAVRDFKNGKRHGLWETYGPRKVTLFHGRYVEDEPQGWHVWRFANGKRQAEEHYDRGIKTDLWRDFYEDGQLKRERLYSDGVLVGKDSSYFENGVKASEISFKDGVPDGLFFEWHPNGVLKRAIPYEAGVLEGFESRYDSKLSKQREIEWREGKLRADLHFLPGADGP